MPRGGRALPPRCVEILQTADAILHAGDLMRIEVLRQLQRYGPPVHAVHGNVDDGLVRQALPERATVTLQGVRIGMVHDAGPRTGRLQRLKHAFPEAQAVIFGHSHIPLHEEHRGFQIFNPGSPTERRRSPTHTMGVATVSEQGIGFELIHLD